MKFAKKEQVTIEVKDGFLTIRVGVNLLCHAVQYAEYGWDDEYKIEDKEVFAKDMAVALLSEEEDGTTPVHRIFDAAAADAIENGSEGVVER